MSVAVITGSAGLVGSETARLFAEKGMEIVGIDNDMRADFFGEEGSTAWNRRILKEDLAGYVHYDVDIRDGDALEEIFRRYEDRIDVIVHTAAQPSHDWAARDPITDFTVNANGTLQLLEAARGYCPSAPFIFTSTNKVYGDRPNRLPFVEKETRWEVDPEHPYAEGIDEEMPVDRCKHSLFGASKLAADQLVQEYGRYFGLKTACFRGGCLTGPNHAGTEMHGFLAYLMKCTVEGTPYTVFGHKGKQVRDNIHVADLARAFWAFFRNPRVGEVYNIGGGRESHCSMQEAIELCEEIAGRELETDYDSEERQGDHRWYVSDLSRFRTHYPSWGLTYDVPEILEEIFEFRRTRRVGT